MFGTPKMPAPPSVPDPVRIPSPDDPDLLAARRQKMAEEFAKRGGRESTNLTADSSPTYSRTTLG